jgi:uncharacterized protein (TIGR00369 family)
MEKKFNIAHQLKQLEGQYFTQSHSKAGQWLHYKILRVQDGEVEVSLSVREEMTNPSKMLHGGMAAMICDEICGLAFYSTHADTIYTTVNLSIDYLWSTPLGSTIFALGKVIRKGKKIANTECTIYDEHRNIIVHAKSNLLNTEKPSFQLAL